MLSALLKRLSPVALLVSIALVASGCGGSKPVATAPTPEVQRLGSLAGIPLVIPPLQASRVAPELAWTGLPVKTADLLAAVDRALADTLNDRIRNKQWIFSEALVASAKANPTYAADPHFLSIQPLRSPKLEIGQRLPEPLASQLRTMIALHDARMVLIPVELRFDKTPAGVARPVLHFVLVDPRRSDVTWIGDVPGPEFPAFTLNFIPLLASHVADLFVAR